ncbi:hypothetical protein EDB84DRAFT_1583468 [Lactarius hengduanensis]|nr:hypothetical protein EDB84DRAFT_1583468 [Lactarius hengduanensis]
MVHTIDSVHLPYLYSTSTSLFRSLRLSPPRVHPLACIERLAQPTTSTFYSSCIMRDIVRRVPLRLTLRIPLSSQNTKTPFGGQRKSSCSTISPSSCHARKQHFTKKIERHPRATAPAHMYARMQSRRSRPVSRGLQAVRAFHTHAYSIYERVNKVPGTLPRMMLASIPRASRTDAETLCASIGSSTKITRANARLLLPRLRLPLRPPQPLHPPFPQSGSGRARGICRLIGIDLEVLRGFELELEPISSLSWSYGGVRQCAIQAMARGEGVPAAGLDEGAALPAEDEIVRRIVGR